MAKVNDLAATDRALATIQAALSGGAIKLAGTLGAASAVEAGEKDAAYLANLLSGLIAAIQSDSAN